ncbi:MAG TPA: MBL fold metallo-hydrolase [Trueperaceae bacterium]|nr:MBL fold metallo-hydrolase [Trueperaceae bacterium]
MHVAHWAKRPVKEPHLKGAALIESIDQSLVGHAEVAVWWLGQSGYVFKTPDAIVVVDPYLSEHLTSKYASTDKPHVRMTASPLRGVEITNADLVISTHKHSDHLDPETIPDLLSASPAARLVIPRPHLDHVLGWGVAEERVVLADVEAPLAFPGVELVPIAAAHEAFDVVAGQGYPYLGFIVRLNGVCLYHSGDTIPYPGLIERLSSEQLDAAFIPINGRDARRHANGTAGNCSIEEALCVAHLAGAHLLVPHHYDMFTFNTADIEEFKVRAGELYPGQEVLVMECGREYRLHRRRDRGQPLTAPAVIPATK